MTLDKLCIDCKHCIPIDLLYVPDGDEFRCKRPVTPKHNLVIGDIKDLEVDMLRCKNERYKQYGILSFLNNNPDRCGEEGKFFEPKQK